jgi:hypothetical protein
MGSVASPGPEGVFVGHAKYEIEFDKGSFLAGTIELTDENLKDSIAPALVGSGQEFLFTSEKAERFVLVCTSAGDERHFKITKARLVS